MNAATEPTLALERRLRASLASEPVEAGASHSLDRVIEAALAEGLEEQLVACLQGLPPALRTDTPRLFMALDLALARERRSDSMGSRAVVAV